MKAAPFEYARAGSLAEACALLAQHGPDAKLIAGGQSLVPMMAMRLARPAWLVDINEATDLQHIAVDGDYVHVGGGVRQARLERDAAIAAKLPLLPQALRWVGHAQTRNRGTPGGSMVHADPSAEIPLVAVTLDAQLRLVSEAEETWMPAQEFFLAPMVTAIAPDQCLAELRFPVWRDARVGCAFQEVAIRHGDFALASACAQVALDEAGRCTRAAIGVGGAGPVPVALTDVAGALIGSMLDERVIADAASAAAAGVEPEADLHASAEYRRHLAQVLVAAALRAAREAARTGRAS
ncbi:MAG TPA: FAD binding domain-containing protein [Burkholderiales bacterium]|nr:FAD binding domain-containing protein [Burkholderiales bacterium]